MNKVTKSPPARRGAGSSRRSRATGAGHRRLPPLNGARVGMELPPQGVAKDLTPGFLPLHLGWGPNPKGKGGERSRGQEGGKRLAEREAKQSPFWPVPRAAAVCAGAWGQSQILQPLWRGYSSGRVNLRGQKGSGAEIWMPWLYLPVTAASGPGGAPGSGGSCLLSWVPGEGRLAPGWAGTSTSRGPLAW